MTGSSAMRMPSAARCGLILVVKKEMDDGSYLLSVFSMMTAGLLCGLFFKRLSSDRSVSIVTAGLVSSFLGWGVGLALPILQHRFVAVLAFSFIFAFDGAFAWWARNQHE